MYRLEKNLRSTGIAFAVILYLDLIGLPLKFGRTAIWIFAFVLALFTYNFVHSKKDEVSLRDTVMGVFFVGLLPAMLLAGVTAYFAGMQAEGVRVTEIFAQLLPEHTGALSNLTREEVLVGANPMPGLTQLVLYLTAGSTIGALAHRIPFGKILGRVRSADKKGDDRDSVLLFAGPFAFFLAYLALRLPSVKLLGPQENILGLVLLYIFFGLALYALRSIQNPRGRIFFIVTLILATLWIPLLNDLFQNAVLGIVTIFVIMGIGLNIVVGYSGMLDLGYVAFFAVGAYSYALLSAPESWVLLNVQNFNGIPFWGGMVVALFMGALAGILLGIPVLRLRGDYLAIVTLGFGEIIRLIVLNLREYTGGPGGVLDIPPPIFLGNNLGNPRDILYVAMAFAAVVAFLAVRLRDSRLGRAWVAMREDEDVAQAMGINLVSTKLLAFAFGATFAAASGVVYASRQVNVFPDNFALDVSINVLSLIIIGGIGSLEGVVLGSIALIGLPEILRSVNEYRIITFGALLVIMMILRPEGLLPSRRHMRELHQSEAEGAATGELG